MLSNLIILLQLSSIYHNLQKYASKYIKTLQLKNYIIGSAFSTCVISVGYKKDLCKLFALIHQLICFNRLLSIPPCTQFVIYYVIPLRGSFLQFVGPQIYIKFRVNCKQCFYSITYFALSIDYPYVSILSFTVYIIFRIKMRTAEC